MANDMSPFAAFEHAVVTAGGQSAFARMVGCTPGNISQLLKKRSNLPGRFVLIAERKTGVSRSLLRPDLYPFDDPVSSRSLDSVGSISSGHGAVACDQGALSHRATAQ